uniref:Uncharacterized protein n=1 Tax=Anguilla anguilla TaxID=7936 RepID=A0A0E9R1P1_ANGAN
MCLLGRKHTFRHCTYTPRRMHWAYNPYHL